MDDEIVVDASLRHAKIEYTKKKKFDLGDKEQIVNQSVDGAESHLPHIKECQSHALQTTHTHAIEPREVQISAICLEPEY